MHDSSLKNWRYLPRQGLQQLCQLLQKEGYEVWGPKVRDDAIMLAPMEPSQTLVQGLEEKQEAGRYRLEQGEHARQFAWSHGPQSIKTVVFPPRQTLWRAKRDKQGNLSFEAETAVPTKRAILGVRACDLAALALLDAHFMGEFTDAHYAATREGLFLVAVNCSHPSDVCFCASTGDGPDSESADLVLDELDDGFLIAAYTKQGQELLASLDTRNVFPDQEQKALAQRQRSRQQLRQLPADLEHKLAKALTSNRWSEIANRCLACGNCTAVCPTCFCHRQMDESAVDGAEVDHVREWDSCFNQSHSYIHGLTIHAHTAERYRQWFMHKLFYWHEQYGRSGCVGCGRCISWCPAAIDLVAEANILSGGGA